APRLLGRGASGAEASLSPLLRLLVQHLAGPGPGTRRTALAPGDRDVPRFLRGERPRSIGMSAAVPMGVVGVGSLGFHHARILREVSGAEMRGIYDSDAERARRVAEELEVHAFPSLEALLDEVKAAVVAVPTVGHHAVAMEALRRGVHLLIEKPLATTLEEAAEIVDLAARQGVLVGTGHVERFNSALRAAEQYVRAPRFVESHRLAPFNPRGTDVAVVLDLMIHDIDLVLSLVRAPVAQVDAVGVPVLTPSVDIANARLRFEGGAVANITASRV